MRRHLPVLLTVLSLLASSFLYAQTTSDGIQPPDDMPFILIIALAFLSIMMGGFIIGFIAMCILLAGMLALIMIGILSSSILVGIYKKSFLAAFRTFLLSACGIYGALAGLCGVWLVDQLFHLNISNITLLATGSIAGLMGGILLALSTIGLIRVILAWATKTFSPEIH